MRLAKVSSFSFAAAILASSLNLGYGATTDPVGAVTVPVASGTTVISIPFQKSVDFQGTVTVISGSDVTLSGSLPILTNPTYLQVTSGTDLGRIYSIGSYADDTVTLTDVPTGLAVLDTVKVRSHMVLNDIDVPIGATITLLNGLGNPTVAVRTPIGWTQPGDTILYPGEAFIINTSIAFDLTLHGSVSVDDVILRLDGGSNTVGNLDPVSGSAGVLSSLLAGLNNGAVLIELIPFASPLTYTKTPIGWLPDTSGINVSDYRSLILNSSTPVDVVLPANVVD